jgi:putative ABC transport system permease protein
MRLIDQLRSVRHTFDSNRARVALTLLGIMIGTGSIVLLASLLEGGQEALLTVNQEASETDLVRVDKAAPSARHANRTRRELSQGDAEVLGRSPILPSARVTTERIRWTRAYKGKEKKRVMLVAAAPVALSLYRLELGQGRFLSDDDLHDGRRVCVVGINVWRELLGSAPSLDGLTVQVDGIQWSVIGVLKNKPVLGSGEGPWMWNNKVVVPRTTFNAIFYRQGQVDQIYVRLGNDGQGAGRAMSERLSSARNIIRGVVLRRHFGVENFKVDRDAKDVEQMNMIMLIIKILLVGTGLLSLLVGGINIMNIMLVTVTERTREIGVRRAVGADPRSIIWQFLLESALIALAGGVIGVVGGIGIASLIAAILTRAMGQWSLHIEPWSIALGLALSIATGVVFGLFPAWRASRLDPVEALRSV